MRPRSPLATVVAVTFCAYVAADLIHEVLGHGTASFLTPGVRALSLSSVALQTSGQSRFVSAAGSIANVLAGVLAFWTARSFRGLNAARYFLLLLGAVDLLNGMGYLLFSAVLGIGDWAAVIRGLEPALAWRAALGIVGAASYVISILATGREFRRSGIGPDEISRLIFPAYVAGGLLLVAASAMNPIDRMLILTSGTSAGFGAPAGLLAVPGLVARPPAAGDSFLSRSVPWLVAGAIVAGFFVVVVGRGIAL